MECIYLICQITNGGKGYVCFPDGTQICYGTLSSTGYTSVNHNLIFAKPFIDTEYVVILTKGTNGKFITEFGEAVEMIIRFRTPSSILTLSFEVDLSSEIAHLHKHWSLLYIFLFLRLKKIHFRD